MALRYRAPQDRDEEEFDHARDARIQVTRWARELLNANENVTISVTAPRCGEAECARPETIVLVMRPDAPTRAIKICKSVEAVSRADVAEALEALVTSIA